MTIGDSLLYDSGAEGMKIRVRGNSSSYYRHKKPYKIKLNKKQDLSGRRYESLENLNRGIYIVNGKKTFIH